MGGNAVLDSGHHPHVYYHRLNVYHEIRLSGFFCSHQSACYPSEVLKDEHQMSSLSQPNQKQYGLVFRALEPRLLPRCVSSVP
jgi:hypothetical protein